MVKKKNDVRDSKRTARDLPLATSHCESENLVPAGDRIWKPELLPRTAADSSVVLTSAQPLELGSQSLHARHRFLHAI
ncbi:hypothetical protein M0R45_021934 [Rubus argutus]|uniref:Uncharacterized protein n=1 Tax=Rubus argutus TaxID=59490 RepID=A0AAW1XD50_RUBAR